MCEEQGNPTFANAIQNVQTLKPIFFPHDASQQNSGGEEVTDQNP